MEREVLKDLHFPKAGIDVSAAFVNQPNRPITITEYARTTRSALNVMTWDRDQLRMRGGSRPGIAKYLPNQIAGTTFVSQLLDSVAVSMAGQTSASGRVVYLVAVSQGKVFTAVPGATTWAPAVNATGVPQPLNFSGLIFSAANGQKLYFADGVNWTLYDPVSNSVEVWAPGTTDLNGNAITSVLPVDSAGNTPRLICTWRGRTVLSGLLLDPQDWFMSAVNDPTNFDYGPLSQTATQATAGSASQLGLVGDPIMSMCPYNDDTLIFFCSNSIYILAGDPLAGGQMDRVTDVIGGTWGICWCKDPYGTVYFCSNRMGIYSMVPGQAPQRISQPIESLLLNINTGNNSIRMVWNDRYQCFHLFVTPLAAAGVTQHFTYEVRTNAWNQIQFGSPQFDPLCCVDYDGNGGTDRTVLLGCWDGYVRAFGPTATDDDGTPISSSVVIGPLLTPNFDVVLMKDIQAVLGTGSGAVNYAIYAGYTAEEALSNTPLVTGTFNGGLNFTSQIRVSGHAIYIELTSTAQWALEAIRVRLASQGKVRMRGK